MCLDVVFFVFVLGRRGRGGCRTRICSLRFLVSFEKFLTSISIIAFWVILSPLFLDSKYIYVRPFHKVSCVSFALFCIFKHFFSACFNLFIFYQSFSSPILSSDFLIYSFIHLLSSHKCQLLHFSALEFLLLNRCHISGGILEHTDHSYFKSCLIRPFSESLMGLFLVLLWFYLLGFWSFGTVF